MPKKIRYAYCKVCNKEVEKSSRKPLSTMQKTGWVVIIIITLGIGALVYLIYRSNRPKSYCPTCFTKLEFSDEPFIKPEDAIPLTPKEKVLKKAGKEIKPKEGLEEKAKEIIEKPEKKPSSDETFCPYCGEDIESGIDKCPYCGSSLKAPHEK
jgi:uncharacterized protein with PIN domain